MSKRPSSGPQKSSTKPAKRIPIEHQIEVRFPNFEGFVTRVSANLSTTGMFIQSEAPGAVGSEFAFRLRIEDWSPIQGTARVVWNRQTADGDDRPPGMGVRFLELDAQSRRMIRWLVDKHLREGGTPFELGAPPLDTSPLQVHGEGVAGGPRPPTPRRATRPRARRFLLALLALVALAAAAYWAARSWPSSPARERMRPIAAVEQASRQLRERFARSRADADSASAETASEDEGASSVSAPPAGARESVAELLARWADAWSNQRTEEVLAFYAPGFEPAEGGDRSRWQARIERRIAAAEFIRMAVSAMEASFPTDDTATASFYRSYRSDTEDETRRMELDLALIEGEWKIVGERSAD